MFASQKEKRNEKNREKWSKTYNGTDEIAFNPLNQKIKWKISQHSYAHHKTVGFCFKLISIQNVH